MVEHIENGSSVDVEGVTCYLPPVGYGVINGKLVHIGVFKAHKHERFQKWQVDERFKHYKEWKKIEDARRKTDKTYVHEELADFINDCWKYRLGGFWFYNNGKPTYITGLNWYFLSVFQMDIGLPRYRDMDRQFFYLWQYVVEHPKHMGALLLTKRRSGKSYILGCISVESSTRSKNFNAGIQSKTEDDALKLFRKCVIAPYRKLPYFFQVAKSNMNTTGKVSDKELRFYDNRADADLDEELDSKVDYKASNAVAYDGQKLGFYGADEVGKPQDVDINNRWQVVQFCLKDFDGGLVGKTLHTTTVEDMEGGNKAMISMWMNSDQSILGTKNKEGREVTQTISGMLRMFIPGHKVRCLDEYGIADEERAIKEIMEEREAKRASPSELASIIRKDPMSIEEAFLSDSERCVFNPILLGDREMELKFSEKRYIVGDLVWCNDKWGDVRFVENPNGQFLFAKDFVMPEELKNRHYDRMGVKAPANNHLFSMGVDTYDHNIVITRENKRTLSKGAFVVMCKSNEMYNFGYEEAPVCIYKHRRPNPEDFYQDAIKAMLYFGCEALIERDKPALIQFMEKINLDLYATRLQGKNERGIKASTTTTNNFTELTDVYINNHINEVEFLDLIDEWKSFNPSDTTVSDLAMAFGYAILLIDIRKPKMNKTKSEFKDVKQIFGFYK